MISNQLVKSEFVARVLERDVLNIFNAQRLITEQNIYIEGGELNAKRRKGSLIGKRSGRLMDSLENPSYSISGSFIVVANIVQHMRFLDMKHMGNRKIYNRQVWGILYNNALPDIKYNVGNEVRDLIGEELQRAFDKSNYPQKQLNKITQKGVAENHNEYG